MIRIGTNPIAWSNDDDRRLGADIPLARCLSEASAIGFEGIEKGHKMPSEAPALRDLLAPHGLALISAWHSAALLHNDLTTERRRLQAHLALLLALGCDVCIVCETTGAVHGQDGTALAARPRLASGDWARFATGIESLAADCLAAGIQLVYHHHMGTVIQDRDEIDALMARTGPATGLLLDTGHALFAGADPVALARDHGARIGHLHLKNVRLDVMQRALRTDSSFLAAVRAGVFTVPGDGEGAIDFAAVLDVAASHHYSGWLVVEAEQDPAQRAPLEYQRLGHDTLVALAHRSGLQRQTGPRGEGTA